MPGWARTAMQSRALTAAGKRLEAQQVVEVSKLVRDSLFQGLSDAQIDDLLRRGKQISFQPGELIVRKGDYGDTMYIILSGLVEVVRFLGKEGPQFTRLALAEGEFFGELALLSEGQPRTANVIAIEPTTCLMLSRPEVEHALLIHPLLALSMLKVMSRRLRAVGP